MLVLKNAFYWNRNISTSYFLNYPCVEVFTTELCCETKYLRLGNLRDGVSFSVLICECFVVRFGIENNWGLLFSKIEKVIIEKRAGTRLDQCQSEDSGDSSEKNYSPFCPQVLVARRGFLVCGALILWLYICVSTFQCDTVQLDAAKKKIVITIEKTSY